MADNDGRLHIVIDGDSTELQKALKQITSGLQNTQKDAESFGKALDSSMSDAADATDKLSSKIAKLGASYLSIAGAKQFVSKVYEVRSYFQDIESSMRVFLGDAEKANKFTADLKDYAWYNMFEFSDLADASKQLIAYGNEVSRISGKGGILDQLSNIATATKQPLMDLVNMWNKAKNQGFVNAEGIQSWAAKGLVIRDVLKEMGEEVDGNKVSFEQLQMAIAHVTEEGQMFGGIMDEMMPNLSSSWGQLQDDLASMWNEIGEAMQESLKKGIEMISAIVDNYQQVGKAVASLIGIYGTYKAALLVVNTIEKVGASLTAFHALQDRFHASTKKELTIATYAAATAQKALNAAMLTNPFVAIATGLAAVISAYVIFGNKAKTAAECCDELNEAVTELKDLQAETSAISSLADEYDTLREKADLSATESARLLQITKELSGYMPGAVSAYDEYGNAIDLNTEKIREQIALTEEAARKVAESKREQAEAKRAELEAQLEENRLILSGKANRLVGTSGYDKHGNEILTNTHWETIDYEYPEEFVQKAAETVIEINDQIGKINEEIGNYTKTIDGYYTSLSEFDSKLSGLNLDQLKQVKTAIEESIKNGEKTKITLGDFFEYDFTGKKDEFLGDALKSIERKLPMAGGSAPDKTKYKDAEEIKRDLDTLKTNLDQYTLKSMEDSSAKSLKQLELNYQKEIETLNKNEAAALKKVKSEADKQKYKDLYSATAEAARTAYEEAKNEILVSFGSLESQYAALEKKWNETIANAPAELKGRAALEKVANLAAFKYDKSKGNVDTETEYNLLKEKLDAERALLDEGVRDVQAKKDALTLATFKYDNLQQYASTDKRRELLKEKLDAEIALVDESQQEMARLQNEYTLAEFDYNNVSEFGSYDQKKDALAKMWDARINTIEDAGQKAEALKAKSNALYELEKQYSGVYALIFAQAGDLTKAQLAEAIEATNKAIENADKSDIKALSELYEQLNAQMNEMSNRTDWGFGAISSGFSTLREAKELWKQYANEVDEARKKELLEQAVAKQSQGRNTVQRGFNEVGSVFSQLGSALSEFEGALADIGAVFSEIGNQADTIGKAFTGALSTGEAISAGISGVIQLGSMIGKSIQANKKAQEEWNKTVDECAQKYKMLQLEALDYKQQNVFGIENPYKRAIDGALQYAESMKYLKSAAADLAKGQIQTGTKKVVDWSNVGNGAAIGAGAGAAVGSIIPGIVTAIGAAIGAAIGLVTGAIAGAFSTKTVPIFESLASQYSFLYDEETYELNPQIVADYEKLDDATKRMVDNWEEIKNKAKEAEEQMRQNFSDLAGDIGNQLSDSLVAAFRNGDLYSAIDDFHTTMTKTIEDILSQLVFSSVFGDMFDQLEERMMKSFKSGGDQDITDDLIWMEGEYQNSLENYNTAMKQVRDALRNMGYDVFEGEDERTANTKGIAQVSQGSVDELNGRFTAIQGHTFEINENVREVVSTNKAIMANAGDLLNEVRTIRVLTDEMNNRDEVTSQDIAQLRSDLSWIRDKGLNLKTP